MKMSREHYLLIYRGSISNTNIYLNMILTASILLLAVTAVYCQVPGRDYRVRPYYDETPKPYAFSYNAVLEDGIGQISRTETADGTGRVQGSYSLANDEGHTRIVDYVADHDGFRAHVRTNEPGTDNQNPADVVMESSNPYANRHFHYSRGAPARRPVATEPAAPEIVPVEPAPENVLPPAPRRPVSRRPPVYRRPVARNPF